MVKCVFLIVGLVFGLSSWAMRDPTMPANARTVVSIPTIQGIDMILTSGSRKIAVINGQYASVGDIVVGNRVVDIGTNAVVLENTKTGERKSISLAAKDVKTNAQR